MIAGDPDFVDFSNVLAKKWNKEVRKVGLKIIQNAGHLLWVGKLGAFEKEFINALTDKLKKLITYS